MPCRATQDGQIIVESSDKTWSTGRRLRGRGCANCQSLPQAELFVRQRERPGMPSQALSWPPRRSAGWRVASASLAGTAPARPCPGLPFVASSSGLAGCQGSKPPTHRWIKPANYITGRPKEGARGYFHSRSLLKLVSIESVMLSNHLNLCRPLLLLPS